MKKLFFMSLTLLFVLSCNMTSNPCSKIKEADLKSELKRAFNLDIEKIFEKNEVKGTNLCQIVVQNRGNFGILYAAPDSKTFFIGGDVYREGELLGKVTLNRIHENNFSQFKEEIEKVVAFSYKPEGAQKYVYMITDPDCPFCERSKEQVKQWADMRKVEVKVILFPLERIHPQAKDKSIKGICSKMNFNDYLKANYGGNTCDEGLRKINETTSLMEKIAISGTPTFISHNGKRLVGFSPDGLDKIVN